MTRLNRALLVGLLLAGMSALGLPAVSAAEGGLLRLAHLSPDTPAVDVYVDSVADPSGGITLPGVGYGTISDYQRVAGGSYTVSMRAAGADPSSAPVLSTTVIVEDGSARTVAGVGYFASLGLEVLEDDLTLPPAGQGRVRVIDAAASADTLDVTIGEGTSVAESLKFATMTDYVDVPAGATTLEVTGSGGAPVQLPIDVLAGSVISVLVLDRPGGGLTVQTALDAASVGLVPVGGVETGAGGAATADTPAAPVAIGLAGAASLVLLLVLLVTARQRTTGAAPRHAAGG